MDWPEITKDTPLKEIKRIHQQIWQYVVEIWQKPDTPYIYNCVCCEYVRKIGKFGRPLMCRNCPIEWNTESFNWCVSGLYGDWNDTHAKETAERIRDIPFKYELEKKGEEE